MKSMNLKHLVQVSAVVSTSLLSSFAPAADDKVGFQVALNGVKPGHAPLYVSVQDAGQFRTEQGEAGQIIRLQESSEVMVELEVAPGEYAVSIWHDLDEDGEFSRGENYWPTDGWGASGTYPEGRAPSFDEMKVQILQDGQVVAIDMKYYES